MTFMSIWIIVKVKDTCWSKIEVTCGSRDFLQMHSRFGVNHYLELIAKTFRSRHSNKGKIKFTIFIQDFWGLWVLIRSLRVNLMGELENPLAFKYNHFIRKVYLDQLLI